MFVNPFEQDLKEIRKILRELDRTEETHGEYNPYNLTHPYVQKIMHDTLEDLKVRVHVCKPKKVLEATP